ncbi:MAG: hypothetical protein K8T25_20760, partial [Planctomycetia bacterium]|nr:hypothetical protein [Planctomycetia bacterium]
MRSGNLRQRFISLLFLASSFYLAAVQQWGQFAVAGESRSEQVGAADVGDVVLRYRASLLKAKLDHLNLWQHATRLPDANEMSLLAEIRSQPVELRMRMLDQFLAAPDSDTLPIEYIVHAVVGMDSHLRHQAIEKNIRPVLSRIATDSAERRASVRAAMELDAYDEIDGFSSLVVPFLAGSASDFQEGDRGAARCWGLSFERATNAALPGERSKLSDLLLQTDHNWNSSAQGVITQFLAPQLATMDQEQLQKREVRILQTLSWRTLKNSSSALWSKLERNGVRVDSFRSYNERDRKQAAQDAERLAAELRKPGNSPIAFQNYFNLSTAVAVLPKDGRRRIAEQLLAQVKKTASWDSPISLGPPLAALAEEFSPDESVEIVRRYFELDARQRIAPYLVDELPAGLVFLGKLPPANAVTVTRYLSTQKGWLPIAAMRTVAGRLPMDQRVA